MLRTFILFSLFLYVSASTIMASLTYDIPLGDISITYSRGKTTFSPPTEMTNMPGKPDLPCVGLNYLLPFDADLKTVTVRVTGDYVDVAGEHEIPAGTPYIDSERGEVWGDTKNIFNGRDMDTYSTDAFFPAGNISNISTGKMRSYKLVKAYFYPYTYNPVTKKIKKITNAKVVIDYKSEPKSSSVYSQRYAIPASFQKMAQKIAVNYDEFAQSYNSRFNRQASREPGYLIITSTSLTGLSYLPKFIEGKKAHGFNVMTASPENWGGAGNNAESSAVKMKAWLKANYEEMGIEYVLIIGHPTTGDVPMMQYYPDGRKSSYDPFTDYYHSDLSGNWDLNGDGLYGSYSFMSGHDNGPGGLDLYPEVYVGRIPDYGTPAMTNKILQKIHEYSMADPSTTAWRIKGFLPLDNFETTDGGAFGGGLMSKVFRPASWQCKTIYGGSNSYQGTVSAWNSNEFGFMMWQGHGLANLTQYVLNTSSAGSLRSEKPAHCFQVSCHNGKPQQSSNLGYALLKTGAVSTRASSVVVLYTKPIKELGTTSAIRHWAYYYAKHMVQEKMNAGPAMDITRSILKVGFSTDWLNCSEMNLYGCPAVGIFTNATSTFANYTPKVNIGQNALIVNTVGNKAFFSVNNLIGAQSELAIFNVSGQKVFSQAITNKKQLVTAENLSSGIYVVKLTSQNALNKTEVVTSTFSVFK